MPLRAPGRATWLLLAVMLPFWTNLLIRTYALMAVLRPLGLLHSDTAVVIGLVYVHLPFMVLPLWAALDRLDLSLIEASRDLGASAWTTLTRIILPLAAPGIAAGIVITFIPALGAYLTPDLLGGTSSQMIANVIERQFRSANDWPFGAALSFLLIYLTVALMLLRSRRAGSGMNPLGSLARWPLRLWLAAACLRFSTCRSPCWWRSASTRRSGSTIGPGFSLDWYRQAVRTMPSWSRPLPIRSPSRRCRR